MASLIQTITQSRIWKSFFRHGWPDNPLDRSLVMTTNVFFHLLNSLLLFAVFKRMTGQVWQSAFVAALFAGSVKRFARQAQNNPYDQQ